MTSEELFYTQTKPIVEACLAALAQEGGYTTPDFAQLVAVQMADETGYDARGCAHGHPVWRGQNNWSGLSWQGKLINFASVGDYARAWARSMDDTYQAVRHAASVIDAATALGASDWAMSHYTTDPNRPGLTLIQMLQEYGPFLTELYGQSAHPDPEPPAP